MRAWSPPTAGSRRGLARAQDLTPVIDAIERAATIADPRLRWPVGPTSFSARLRPFVPDRLYEWIMRLAFRPRLQAGERQTG